MIAVMMQMKGDEKMLVLNIVGRYDVDFNKINVHQDGEYNQMSLQNFGDKETRYTPIK